MPEIPGNAVTLRGSDSSGVNKFAYCSNIARFKKQFCATVVVCLGGFSIGTVGGYTSPTIDAIQRQFTLNDQEVSLVISISSIGALPAGFVTGAVADFFGRKLAIIFNCALYTIGWVLLLCATNVYMLHAGRIVTGFAGAMTSMCAPVYITEISSPEVRGTFGACFQLSMCIGILYSYVIGAYVSWPYLTLACLGVPALQIVLMLLLPETPTWLTRHNYPQDATSALAWLNQSHVDSEEHKPGEKLNTNIDPISLKSFAELALLKPLAILCTQMFVQQFSGVGIVMLYAATIFRSATEALDPNMSAIIIASSMLAACCVASVLVDRLGRKILLMVSGVFMSVGMISLATYYYFQAVDSSSVERVTWLPIVSLVVYEFAYGIGFGPVPWLMMGEVFPNRARGLASGIVTTFSWTMAFITAKTFVDMRRTMHDYGVFWMCGAVSVFAVFFSYFFVPETKGKTLDEIELYFKKTNKDGN